MEEECEVFMDPDEDEIFFGKITDKEVTVNAKIKNPESTLQDKENDVYVNIKERDENYSENIPDSLMKHANEKENVLKEIATKQNAEKTCDSKSNNIMQIKQENICEKPAVNVDSSAETLCKGILEDIIENISSKETIIIKQMPVTPQIKTEDLSKASPNIQLDHNYSTPVKSIIDKSILATPKSVVKADKDGGFLKVLSEIALVKAEADIEKSLNKEDEDKENKNVNIGLKVPEVKVTEPTPDKSGKSPSPKKFNLEMKKFRLVYNTPEKIDSAKDYSKDNSSLSTLPKIEDVVKGPELNEQALHHSEPSDDVKIKRDNVDLLEKNLEEFENQFKKVNKEITESVTISNDNSAKNIKLLAEDEIIIRNNAGVPKIVEFVNSSSENIDKKSKEDEIFMNGKSETEEIIIDSPVIKPEVKNEKYCDVINVSSDSDVQILDNTSEIKVLEKSPNIRMSEEARKVVEILNSKAQDDSFNFTIQEIDVDKTDIPFASPEISDMFNDSLSKPISNKQTELLRELLTATPKDKVVPIPFKTPISAKVPSTKKLYVTGEKQKLIVTPLIPKKTPMTKVLTSSKINSTNKTTEKEKYSTPLISEKKTSASAANARWNPVERSLSAKKCVKRLNVDEITSKEGDKKDVPIKEKETKAPGTSKIPKFGQFSKIPVSGTKMFQPANKLTPTKTPKSSTYSKIESPVNAYIHNRPTPLIKNIKPEIKKDSAKKVWIRQAAGSAKKLRNEEQTQKVEPDRCKTALPYVEYRSATPLKLEKPIESKLPRLAPTMKKLITANSPTVLKHEGRIHLNIQRKVPIRAIDNSVMVDPNEVSVVVSHVAQKSNTISK